MDLYLPASHQGMCLAQEQVSGEQIGSHGVS